MHSRGAAQIGRVQEKCRFAGGALLGGCRKSAGHQLHPVVCTFAAPFLGLHPFCTLRSLGGVQRALTCGLSGVTAAHLREVRLLHSGRHDATAKTPDRSTILMSPKRSGAMLTVISRPSYITLAPTSNDEPCNLLLLT